MRRIVYRVGFGLFTVAGGYYITAPFHQDFDVNDAPESPPLVSAVSSSSAAMASDGHVWDAMADQEVDVRPPYRVRVVRLST